MRRVVVAVRAENGPNLPVMYLDRAVTRTDAGGAASFALEVPPGSQFTVALNTIERRDIFTLDLSKEPTIVTLYLLPGRDQAVASTSIATT